MKQIIQKTGMVIAVLFGSFTASAYDFEVDGVCYDITSFTDLTVTASSLSDKTLESVVIPSMVSFNGKELSVTSIGDNFAKGNETLASIQIGNGILSIGSFAFMECSNLSAVSISESILEIGEGAFLRCGKIDNILATGTTIIGTSAFSGCSSITKIGFPNVLEIRDKAFSLCTNISTLDIGKVEMIGKQVFEGCMFNTFIIPETVKTLGDASFLNCINLVNIVIPNNVETIGDNLFSGCSSLKEVTIGAGIKYLPWIFENCTSLVSLRIEDSSDPLEIAYVGSREFKHTGGSGSTQNGDSYYYYSSQGMFAGNELKNVYIGRNITTETFQFRTDYESGAYKMSHFIYVPNPPFANSKIEKVYLSSNVTDLTMCYTPREGSTLHLKPYASFQNCIHLAEVETYAKINSIPNNTFANCSSLQEIIVPNSVTYIGSNAFQGCAALKTIDLGCYLESIGASAFEDCAELMTLNLRSANPPKYATGFSSTQYINMNINVPKGSADNYKNAEPWKNFWNLNEKDNLISLFEADGIMYLVSSENIVDIIGYTSSCSEELLIEPTVSYLGQDYSIESISENAFKGCNIIENVIIKNGVKRLGKYAFENCKNLREIKLASSITILEDGVFKNCSGLKTCVFENPIEELPSECFYNCKSLIEFNLQGVRKIGHSCFYDCDAISKLIITPSVEFIGESAFYSCSNLNEVAIEDSEDPIHFPAGIYDTATGIQKTEINGQTVRYKIQYYNGFFNGLPIKKLYLGRSLSDSPRYTISGDGGVDYYLITSYDAPFNKLPYLKELTISKNVDVIGPNETYIDEIGQMITAGSFKNCESLEIVNVMNPIPPTGAEFSEKAYKNSTLYVPEGSKNAYELAEGWKEFSNIVEGNYIPVESFKIEQEAVELPIDGTLQLTVLIEPENATPSDIEWKSSNEKVVVVSESGFISGVSEGSATVTAVMGDFTATCEVTIYIPIIEAEKVVLNLDKVELNIGETVQLEATILPEDTTDKTHEWESSNEEVAIVDDSGLVIAIGEGTAIITVTCGEASAQCEITVIEENGVENIFANPNSSISIYSTDGIIIKKEAKVEDLKTLVKGIYIIVSGKDRYKISI